MSEPKQNGRAHARWRKRRGKAGDGDETTAVTKLYKSCDSAIGESVTRSKELQAKMDGLLAELRAESEEEETP